MRNRMKIILERSELGNLRWEISAAKSLMKQPRSQMIPYEFTFRIWNNYDYPLRTKVQITSPTQEILFQKRIYKMIGRSRITKMENSLEKIVKHEITNGQKKDFIFSALLRPQLLYPLSSSLEIQYCIFARNDEKRFSIQSDSQRLKIPIERVET